MISTNINENTTPVGSEITFECSQCGRYKSLTEYNIAGTKRQEKCKNCQRPMLRGNNGGWYSNKEEREDYEKFMGSIYGRGWDL